MRNLIKRAYLLVCASIFSIQTFAQTPDSSFSYWAYDRIHISASKSLIPNRKALVVAVIDDAFNLTHDDLKGFVYTNPLEIPANQLDDDGNNYVDDVQGWDISDRDNSVKVLEGREAVFYHGTYVASIITKVARLHYGEKAAERIKILPVKVISDDANRTYVKDGYKGIKYAMENGADIICLAWSGGHPGEEDLKILKQAHQKGILIIAAAGNFNEEKVLYPAMDPNVLAVAGVDMNLQKMEVSNYGISVDISAPAENVLGAHPIKDNAYIHENGTSASAALVAACAAVIMSKKEGFSNRDVKDILMNSATPFDEQFKFFGGKMGAGILNLKNAIEYLSDNTNQNKYYSSLRSKGSILVKESSSINNWEINPVGTYHGFYLEADISNIRKPEKHAFKILVADTIWAEYNLSNYPPKIYVPSQSLVVQVKNHAFKKKDVLKISYSGKAIDSTRLYCCDILYLNAEKGMVTDGSGENNYANYSACKWQISVPAGKRIKFTFDQMDTQANVDFVYLVDGQSVLRENYIALFSGKNKPPVVISRTNEVLVWFVTDKTSTGQGWQFHYEAVD